MIRVQNGDRELEFDGTLLSEASSDDGRAQRWTVICIYRAADGRYVLTKTGRSVVYHTATSSCKGGVLMTPEHAALLHPDEVLIACRNCDPADIYTHLRTQQIRAEVDRSEATVLGTPDAVVKHLHMEDADGVRFLSRVATRALEEAAQRDPELRSAYLVETL